MAAHHIDTVTGEIVDAAIKLHKELGPGLLESVYEAVLAYELQRRGLSIERQVAIDFSYEGVVFRNVLRMDMVVDRRVVVEVKSVEMLAKVHPKQVLTYLRLADLPVGLLLNFGAATMKEGLHRIVNRYPHSRSTPLPTRSPSASPRLRVR